MLVFISSKYLASCICLLSKSNLNTFKQLRIYLSVNFWHTRQISDSKQAANLVHIARKIMFVGIENRIRRTVISMKCQPPGFQEKTTQETKSCVVSAVCMFKWCVCLNTSISEDTEPQGSSRQNQMRVVSNQCTLNMKSLRCSC